MKSSKGCMKVKMFKRITGQGGETRLFYFNEWSKKKYVKKLFVIIYEK